MKKYTYFIVLVSFFPSCSESDVEELEDSTCLNTDLIEVKGLQVNHSFNAPEEFLQLRKEEYVAFFYNKVGENARISGSNDGDISLTLEEFASIAAAEEPKYPNVFAMNDSVLAIVRSISRHIPMRISQPELILLHLTTKQI